MAQLQAAVWNKTYAELVAYKEAHGHWNVPQSSGPLGTRCGNLRVSRKNGTLSREKIAQLDALESLKAGS
jgi:hypothetical protein